MGDLIQKAGPFALIVFFVWYTWSGYGEATKKASGGKKRAGLSDEFLVQRKSGEALPPFSDPFFADWSPYGPEWSEEAISERKRRAEDERKREIAKKRDALIATVKRKNESGGERLFQPFVLQLQSIVVFPEGAVARISEHSVRVGDLLRALDPKAPPVLVRLDSTSADVRHRGKKYGLDLFTRPEIVVDSLQDATTAKSTEKSTEKSTDKAESRPEPRSKTGEVK